MHRIFPALSQRLFRLYFSGQLVSLAGTWLQQAALSWIAYRMTGSESFLGYMALAGQAPLLLLSPLGGALADRFSHRRTLFVTQAGEALVAGVLALLAFAQALSPEVLLAATFLLGVFTAIESPVRSAFLPDLVTDPTKLQGALALNAMSVNSARMLGPALAGMLLLLGDTWCFALNALSYVGSFYTLHRVHPAEHHEKQPGRFRDGVRFVLSHPALYGTMVSAVPFGFSIAAFGTLLPAYVADVVHGQSHTYGFIMAASGLGSLMGWAFFASRFGEGHGGRTAVTGLIGISLTLVAFSLCTTAWAAAIVIFLFSVSTTMVASPAVSLLQVVTPRALRGRVMAIYTMVLMGGGPIGGPLWGKLAAHFGKEISFQACAALAALTAACYARWAYRHVSAVRGTRHPLAAPLVGSK